MRKSECSRVHPSTFWATVSPLAASHHCPRMPRQFWIFLTPTLPRSRKCSWALSTSTAVFLRAVAHTVQPLTDPLETRQKGGRTFWSDLQTRRQPSHLLRRRWLPPPSWPTLFLVLSSASQWTPKWRTSEKTCINPSRVLSSGNPLEPAQTRYSAFNRELLACSSGICHFWHMLEGHRFTIFTDHKPLTYALSWVSDPWTTRQAR